MMQIYIYVPTTAGLVRIQGITKEEHGVTSCVLEDGSTDFVDITDDYDNFVRKGSGVIHTDFGHGAFRVDVNGKITQGKSWQLAFYLAHYALKHGCLGKEEPKSGDLIIWATGELKKVSANREIIKVDGVREKFEESQEQLANWLQTGIKLHAIVPQDNLADLTEELKENYPHLKELSLHAVTELKEAISLIKEYIDATTKNLNRSQPNSSTQSLQNRHQKRLQTFGYVGAIFLLCMLFYTFIQPYQNELVSKTNNSHQINLLILSQTPTKDALNGDNVIFESVLSDIKDTLLLQGYEVSIHYKEENASYYTTDKNVLAIAKNYSGSIIDVVIPISIYYFTLYEFNQERLSIAFKAKFLDVESEDIITTFKVESPQPLVIEKNCLARCLRKIVQIEAETLTKLLSHKIIEKLEIELLESSVK